MSAEDPFRVHVFPVGALAENCYVVGHAAGGEAAVVDPGDEGEALLRWIGEAGLVVRAILLTHGHFDHVGAVGLLRERTGAKVYLHAEDRDLIAVAGRQAAYYGLSVPPVPPPDVLVEEGDVVPFGGDGFRVLHTPGHTRGGTTYLLGMHAFVGDLIFDGSVGRTDLPGGDTEALFASVREKIFTLPDDVVLYPGHGPATTVGKEKRTNPFFQDGIGGTGTFLE